MPKINIVWPLADSKQATLLETLTGAFVPDQSGSEIVSSKKFRWKPPKVGPSFRS